MIPCAFLSSNGLAELVTGRQSDLFLADVEKWDREIRDQIGGARILVIGGAGTIGGSMVRALIGFAPSAIHVVDQNENGLAELVRDLRSDSGRLSLGDFCTFPIDFGSPVMQRLLQQSPPYDIILNFAALKHVRSEKDVCSLLQMLDTNVLKTARLLRWISEKRYPCRYFCVSTDKASNPVNFMGASKRVMEHVIFSELVAPELSAVVTSARFANVAFSDGSLLSSFLNRLERRQPLAAPRDTRRYFITLREAGQICLLAATCTPHRHLLVSRLDPSHDLRELESIAVALLRHHGLEPRIYEDEIDAKSHLLSDLTSGHYPLLLTPLDTSGEKPYEEFVGEGEKVIDIDMQHLDAIEYLPTEGSLPEFLESLEHAIQNADMNLSKDDLLGWVRDIVPEFQHRETRKHLDQRM